MYLPHLVLDTLVTLLDTFLKMTSKFLPTDLHTHLYNITSASYYSPYTCVMCSCRFIWFDWIHFSNIWKHFEEREKTRWGVVQEVERSFTNWKMGNSTLCDSACHQCMNVCEWMNVTCSVKVKVKSKSLLSLYCEQYNKIKSAALLGATIADSHHTQSQIINK